MTTIHDYVRLRAMQLAQMGRVRTSETYLSALNSFMHFCNDPQMTFDRLDATLVRQYEAWLLCRHLSRNSSSFYMRILRCLYNMAVADGLVAQQHPFGQVYTGIDKTPKRAISVHDLRRIKDLNLTSAPSLAYARDMFLFSFYMRGMSFVDMAYLRKCDLRNGFVIYNRHKTGQQLTIRWEKAMQRIIDQYDTSGTQFLLPIILHEDGTERRQYLNKLLYVNRKLKVIGRMARIPVPLTMYVARHSWASVAHGKRIPIAVISEAMGHDSETTTQIYLSTIQSNLIDEANHRIIGCL